MTTSVQSPPAKTTQKSPHAAGFSNLSSAGVLLDGFASRLALGAVHQFDEGHRCVVANAEAHLQDAGVAARAGREARAQLVEQLADDVAIAQTVKSQAAVGQRGLLRQGDQGLNDAAQFLGLGDRGLDRFVLQQRNAHIAQHRSAVGAGAVEFAEAVTVTHGAFPFTSLMPAAVSGTAGCTGWRWSARHPFLQCWISACRGPGGASSRGGRRG
mmetsp:Transcript_23357/g.55455  ORF Transcript_23357/g.55455 Transcript_23357/m.55455 type:complete len:213 (+) Transcript_23357:151-789(+)